METTNLTLPESLRSKIDLRVRCPECFKLYTLKVADVQEARPEFVCAACSTRFWLSFPECLANEEIIGFRMEWLHQPPVTEVTAVEPQVPQSAVAKTFPCPKCETKNVVGAKECGACGIIFSKHLAQFTLAKKVPGNEYLEQKWGEVISDYENEARHYSFIESCRLESQLHFASSKYGQVLEAWAGEPIASKMKEFIFELLHQQLKNSKQKIMLTRRRFPFVLIAIFICVFLMVLGYLVPEYRNLVGLGASCLFVLLAFRYSLRWLSN